ncbi:MAG: molybdenum cofactor biosynthesis protein MoaE [Anaerolineae bacterium]
MNRWITYDPLDLNALIAETEDPSCGALVIFSGTVRNENDGRPVSGMTYEAHLEMAEKVLAEIEQEVLDRFPVSQCRIVHRIGELALGEVSIYVVVRGGHRGEAFDAARYGIDETKKRAPIWKEEHYIDGDSRYLDGTPLRRKEDARE